MKTSETATQALCMPLAILCLSRSRRLYACVPRTRKPSLRDAISGWQRCGYSRNRSPFSLRPSPPSLHALRSTLYAFLAFSALGCSTPRVLEVSSHTRLQDVDVVDHELFTHDRASRLRYEPRDLPAEKQRQEFYVRWRGTGIDLVKFEYRQVDVPNTVKEQTLVLVSRRSALPGATGQPLRGREAAPTELRTVNRELGTVSHVFEVRGEEFHSGGRVSAWRVSLWSGDTLLAERKSTLW